MTDGTGERLTVAIQPELKNRLREMAAAQQRSLTQQVVWILQNWIREEERRQQTAAS